VEEGLIDGTWDEAVVESARLTGGPVDEFIMIEDSCEVLVLESVADLVSDCVICVLSGLLKEEVVAKGDDESVPEKELGI
jgi:hypothetical protein